MRIRPERDADRDAVRIVNATAFDTTAEADLVDALREQARPLISLVADDHGEVAGHIMFSRVTVSGCPDARVAGLAPMAVLPARQREGIGSALVRAGLKRCGELGFTSVVVLGHPEYYPRFGFEPAARFGIDSEYDAPADAFMVLELESGALRGITGTAIFHPAFGGA